MRTKLRVVGSNYTVFNWQNNAIAWLDQVTDRAPRPVGGQNGQNGIEVITPLGFAYPQEIASSRVLTEGSLTVHVKEMWTAWSWQQLTGLSEANTIIEIFAAQAAQNSPISCLTMITPPGASTWHGWQYNNCFVSGVDADEVISLGAMTLPRTISVIYTHRTYVTGSVSTPTT